jgi:hypothetical protein
MVIHMRNGETTLAASYVLIAGGRQMLVELELILMPMGRAWASE